MEPSKVRASWQEVGARKSMKSSMQSSGEGSKAPVTRSERDRRIDKLMIRGDEIDRALQRAVRAALVRHKKLGESVAVWRDGRAVVLSPDEIPD